VVETLVKEAFVVKRLEPEALVKLKVVTVEDPAEKLLVTVRFVVVAFVMVVFWRFVVPEMLMFDPEAFVKFNVVTVVDAAERLPVRTRVVPVAFVKLVFWRVVTPLTVRWPKRLRLVPEASVKLNVVTVEEPALKLPVKASVVPVASV
jgi:hypothetical protein